MWSPLLRAAGLTHAWRVRLPGHGPGRRPAVVPAGFEALVAHTAAALASVGPLHLIGHSMGARLALAIALWHPAHIASLTLIGGSPGLPKPADRRARRQREAGWQASLMRDGVTHFMARWSTMPLFAGEAALPEHRRRRLDGWRRRHTAAGLVACLHGLGLAEMPSLWASLPRLTLPVLCLAGDQDAAYLRTAGRMAEAIGARARAEAVVGAGHNPALEAPQATAVLLRQHISLAAAAAAAAAQVSGSPE